jgi:hypothetical protein
MGITGPLGQVCEDDDDAVADRGRRSGFGSPDTSSGGPAVGSWRAGSRTPRLVPPLDDNQAVGDMDPKPQRVHESIAIDAPFGGRP